MTASDMGEFAAIPWPDAAEGFRLEAMSARNLCAQPDPPDDDRLLGPLVLRNGRTIVAGDTGHGKTTLVAQMTRAIVAAEECLGHVGIGGVSALMIDLEQGLRSIKRGLREARLDEREDVFHVRAPDGLALDSDDAHLAELVRIIVEIGPAVVTLDPYYKAHRAEDPNAERAIVDLMRRLDALRTRFGFALILPAHPRKDTPGRNGHRKLTLHDIAGSGAVTRGAEVVLAIERLNHGYARLRYLKDRDGELPVGESEALLFAREDGFRLDPREDEGQESLDERCRQLGADQAWRTAKEWAQTLAIGEPRAKKMLERFTEAGEFAYMAGPQGRQPSAKCWRGGALDAPAHPSAPMHQAALPTPTGVGALGALPVVEGSTSAAHPDGCFSADAPEAA